jgi:hypothetical protein
VNPNEQQAVKMKLLCSHEVTEYRKRQDSLKRPLIASQCIKCGKNISNFVSAKKFSKEEIDAMPQWDNELEVSWRAKAKAKSGERHLELKEQRALQKELQREQYISQSSGRQAAYSRYINSAEWQELRRKVIARAKGKCEGCGNRPATDVHHLTYQRFGKEMLFDLVAVCEDCHKAIHKQSQAATDANFEIGLALMAQEWEDRDKI